MPRHPPSSTDASLVGQLIYLRWEKYGWQLGKISKMLDAKTAPRLIKKYNYHVSWDDGGKGATMLPLDAYKGGAEAGFNSWLLLERVAAQPAAQA